MKRWLSGFNILGLLVLVAGLWMFQFGSQGFEDAVSPIEGEAVNQDPKAIRLYFAQPGGYNLLTETRSLEGASDLDGPNRAMLELLKGPTRSEMAPLVPQDTPVPKVFVVGELAYIDLPEAYGRLGLGSAGESQLVYGMAYTLLDFPEIKGVKFLLAGKEIDTLGHVALLEPIRRQP